MGSLRRFRCALRSKSPTRATTLAKRHRLRRSALAICEVNHYEPTDARRESTGVVAFDFS